MSASEIINLEKSPPKISTNKKRMMLIDNTIMDKFGKEAFRVKTKTPGSTLKSDIHHTPRKSELINSSSKETSLPSTANVSGYYSRERNVGERNVDKNQLLKSLSDTADLLTKPSIKE